MTIYITLALLFGFFVESIFGFAGSIISLAILGFFIDIKTVVTLILYVSTVASLLVVSTDRSSFSKKEYFSMTKLAIPGAIVGALLFDYLSSEALLKTLAIFLLGLGLKSFFEPKFKNNLKKLLLFISGIVHGIFGLGGVVAIGTMQNNFAHKSQLRVTFAIFFITLNIIRATQYLMQSTVDMTEIIKFWWIPIPLYFVIWLGHKIHLNISENLFKKGIAILLLTAGIFFLLG